jgi:hypothetical protein
MKFNLSKMPYSRRQKKLAKQDKEEVEEIGKEESKEEPTFNLMKKESKNTRGWWKVYYYDKESPDKKSESPEKKSPDKKSPTKWRESVS